MFKVFFKTELTHWYLKPLTIFKRRRRASKCVAAMRYIWKLYSHSFPIQWIALASLPINFPNSKMWQNWAPCQFHIFTQPSHTIPRYGSFMAHVLLYHSHNVSPVKVETFKESTVGRYLDAYFPLALTKSLAKASSFF